MYNINKPYRAERDMTGKKARIIVTPDCVTQGC